MPHLRILINGCTRLAGPYAHEQTQELERALRLQWPALRAMGNRVAVIATDDNGITHIIDPNLAMSDSPTEGN